MKYEISCSALLAALTAMGACSLFVPTSPATAPTDISEGEGEGDAGDGEGEGEGEGEGDW